MKKLKYLLFIIPFLFIFIGNIKAYTLATYNGVDINETYIKNKILEARSDFDFSLYSNIECTVSTSVNCTLFTDSQYNSLSIFRTESTYIWYTISTSPNKYLIYIYSDLTNWQSFNSNNSLFLYFNDNSYHTYTNFIINSFTQKYGSEDYKVLSLVEAEPEPEPEEPTIENKIYLPNELEEENCPIILNQNVIRVYEEEPIINTPVNYTDYFINSHYITQSGTDNLSNSISCMDLDKFTTNYVYRFDFHQIIIIFLSIVIIIGYPLMKIIHAFFIGFKRR